MTRAVKRPKPLSRRPARGATPAEPSPRVVRRERRRERSREEIIEAARLVLLRDGVAATTLEAIAREVGLTKAALYYYFPSKNALLFEMSYRLIEAQSRAVHDAVAQARDGGEALRAIIRETVKTFASRLDDFRMVFMISQLAGPGALKVPGELLASIRPLNELAYAGAAELLAADAKEGRGRTSVPPRLMAFLANLAAIGLLTMKGMVEAFDDPLLYTDDELVDGLARVFEAAARP